MFNAINFLHLIKDMNLHLNIVHFTYIVVVIKKIYDLTNFFGKKNYHQALQRW